MQRLTSYPLTCALISSSRWHSELNRESPCRLLPLRHLLRDHARAQLNRFTRITQPLGDLRAAAVAVVITADNDEGSVLLTRRASSLRAHSGQWALPGGRLDLGESAEEAALRELREEVNLALPKTSVLGLLDDYSTRSGYRITPVVVWADRDAQGLSPNPSEVASIHTAPFSELAKKGLAHFNPTKVKAQRLSVRLSLDQIFAPTAAVLYQFRESC